MGDVLEMNSTIPEFLFCNYMEPSHGKGYTVYIVTLKTNRRGILYCGEIHMDDTNIILVKALRKIALQIQ